ncbi:MAG: glycosyl hydrolase 53 family protein [Treponema sp.]|nr:glycosyl hydrolase 53 family protein [Treponema sp.]
MKSHFERIAIAALVTGVMALGSAGAVKTPAADAVTARIVVEPVPNLRPDFMKGVDVSMVDQIEKSGGVFYNARGEALDVFAILKENGVNCVRIRLWNKPVYEKDVLDQDGKVLARKGEAMGGGNNDIETDIRMAKRVKAAGLQFMLDFHYSDSWADPGKQYMPQDWKKLSPAKLEKAVERFTRDTITRFTDEGASPDYVQIGNELNSGFMWPVGQLWSPDPAVKIGGMKSFLRLLDRASRGVRSAKGGEHIKIIVHLADGTRQDLYSWFFDNVEKAGIDYDIIGLSYYPYWHGTIDALRANLAMISKRYGRNMAVVETAYAFTEENGDFQENVFKLYSDDEHGYVPSVQGQATLVRDCIAAVAGVKGGMGVCYWEADAILCPGAHLSSTEGNTWENQAMFTFDGKALPSLAVWNLVSGTGAVENVWGGSAQNGSQFVPYALSAPVTATVKRGESPELPLKVKAVFTDDSERMADVTWESRDWKHEKAGFLRVKGQFSDPLFAASSCTIEASVTVSDAVSGSD